MKIKSPIILGLVLLLSVQTVYSAPKQPSYRHADDLYAAVNEKVLKEHDAEKTGGSWNWFFDLEDRSYQKQKAIIQTAAATGRAGPSGYKLGTLYTLAMDQARRDLEGVAYLDELQKQLPNIDLRAYLGKIFRIMPMELNIKENASLATLNSYLTAEELPLLKDHIYSVNLQKFAPYMILDMEKARIEMEETYPLFRPCRG